MRWTTLPSPYEWHHAKDFVHEFVADGWARGTDLVWAIRETTDGPLHGVIGLHGVEAGSAEVGDWLEQAARGRGLATASVRAVADFAFGPMGLTRLSWSAHVGNTASRRVAEKAGFRIEGQVRGHCVARGDRWDAWLGTRYADDAVAD